MNTERKIDIAIADAQYLTRKGLRQVLTMRPRYNIVAETTDETALLSKLSLRAADVLILDYNEPRHFDPHTIQKVRKRFPDTQILVISADEDRQRIYEVISSGVNCFLTKECDEDEILGAIEAAFKGEKYFCGKVLDYILQKTFASDGDCAPTPLTPRECEIVELSARGLIAKEIAAKLNLKTHTIYTHKKRIMKKLGLRHSSELVLYAVEKGLVSTDSLPNVR